jgi:hypothetical protein
MPGTSDLDGRQHSHRAGDRAPRHGGIQTGKSDLSKMDAACAAWPEMLVGVVRGKHAPALRRSSAEFELNCTRRGNNHTSRMAKKGV